MIITIFFLAIVIIGLISCFKEEKFDFGDWVLYNPYRGFIFVAGAFFSIIAIATIIVAQVHSDINIKTDNTRYNVLCKEFELLKSDYEDLSKTDVVKEVSEYNIYVQKTKYWAENPWTSWFYSQKHADSLQEIDISSLHFG